MYRLVLRTCGHRHLLLLTKISSSSLKDLFRCRYLCIKPSSSMSNDTAVFQGVVDRYNGVTVNSGHESCKSEDFAVKLDESLEKWLSAKRRAVWFKVRIEESDWVPTLAKKGFKFHHTKDNAVTMYKWLSEHESDRIPSYAHTVIGVGGLVVNDASQVLVVSERYLNFPHWKLPGGVVDPEEDLIDAVIREVEEETGVKTEFYSLLAMRHAHKRAYGCSDLYITFVLKPLTLEIKKCEREIDQCKWMDIDEYLNHPHVHDMNRYNMQKYLEYKEKGIRIDRRISIHEILHFPVVIYHAEQIEQS